MQAESSNIFNEKDNSQTIKIDKEKIICKDGFCSLAGHKQSSEIDKNDVNLFDLWILKTDPSGYSKFE